MSNVVGVRDLRQNLSRYLARVKAGEGFIVTERGEEVARLTPSAGHETPLAHLIAEHGASIPRACRCASCSGALNHSATMTRTPTVS